MTRIKEDNKKSTKKSGKWAVKTKHFNQDLNYVYFYKLITLTQFNRSCFYRILHYSTVSEIFLYDVNLTQRLRILAA